MNAWRLLPPLIVLGLGGLALAYAAQNWSSNLPHPTTAAAWQAAALPGPLSTAHAFLDSNCTACHTANRGVEAGACIACHASELTLLQRQPTAFHADITGCAQCHPEHEGRARVPTRMDHAAIARVALRQSTQAGAADDDLRGQLQHLLDSAASGPPRPPGEAPVTPGEAALNCAACHSNQDPHRGFFGTSCVECHTTAAWPIAEFRHPSPASTSCAQCHQAPPSHYMMHFKMVSMKVAEQPHARVEQCYLCHQTNDWNDIKGAGLYDHH